MSGTLFPFPKEEWNNTPNNKKYANEILYNLNALFHLGSKKTKPNKETTNDNLKKTWKDNFVSCHVFEDWLALSVSSLL